MAQKYDSDLTRELNDVGLDVEYWSDIFKKELNITNPSALRSLDSRDIEKLISAARQPSEKQAICYIINQSSSHHQTIILGDDKLKDTVPSHLNQGERTVVKEVAQKDKQISQVSNIPLELVSKRDNTIEESEQASPAPKYEGYMFADQSSKKPILGVAMNPNTEKHGQADERKANVQNTILPSSENTVSNRLNQGESKTVITQEHFPKQQNTPDSHKLSRGQNHNPSRGHEKTGTSVAETPETNNPVDLCSSKQFERDTIDGQVAQDKEQAGQVTGVLSNKVERPPGAVETNVDVVSKDRELEAKNLGKDDKTMFEKKSERPPPTPNDEGNAYADQRPKKPILDVAMHMNPNTKEHGQAGGRNANVHNTIFPSSEDDYKEVLSKLGLNQYHPSQISLQRAIAIKTLPDNLEASDLPWKLIHMLMGLDQRARNQFLSEMNIQDTEEDLAFGYRDSDTESDDEESNLPLHPMDVLLATFICCDWTLQQVLAQNLFLCKLAIPFLYPVSAPEKLVLSLWALRAIIVQCRGGGAGTVEAPVTDKQFSAITFVRLGSPSLSKSKLLNDVLTDGAHQTFYCAESQRKTAMRRIANGLLECSWYLPAFNKGADLYPDVTLLLNLRGDAAVYQEQMRLVNKVSSVIVVIGNIENINDPANVDTFRNICRSGKQVIQVLTSELKRPDKTLIKAKLEGLVNKVGQDTLDRIKQIRTFDKNMNATEIKTKLQSAMSTLLVKALKISIEKIAQSCERKRIQIDENCPILTAGKRLAKDVFKEVEDKQVIGCKRDMLPLQGMAWQQYSKLEKQMHRAGTKVNSSEAKEGVRNDMRTRREAQVVMCNSLVPFTRSFLSTMLDAKSDEERLAFLQWMKLWLDDKSRATLPRLQRQYLETWRDLQQARSIRKDHHGDNVFPDHKKVEMLQDSVKKAEQDIADASFGLEHIFRELGQIYEASQGSSLITDKTIQSQVKQLPNIAAKLLHSGIPLELLDGDASNVPITWVKAVLSELNGLIGDQKVFVLSVLGVQSSGKSTLLNTMFGLKFAVSAGRCTRGALSSKLIDPIYPLGTLQ